MRIRNGISKVGGGDGMGRKMDEKGVTQERTEKDGISKVGRKKSGASKTGEDGTGMLRENVPPGSACVGRYWYGGGVRRWNGEGVT